MFPQIFAQEQIATFIDADGSPQATNWGAHKVVYSFDRFGNTTDRLHYGTDGDLVESTSGIAQIKTRWTDDGATELSQYYFDIDGQKTASSYSGIHGIITDVDAQNRPVKTRFVDLTGKTILHKGTGYAVEYRTYDDRGRRLIERGFTDTSGTHTNHTTWQVARFTYTYDGENLTSAQAFDAAGNPAKPRWNPAH